tara:strand:- start:13 stop:273 length:261 start_codon:yes stop_codon:yes gene_type:complete
MNIKEFRESRAKSTSRAAFCTRINEYLRTLGLNISISYLRDLESGRCVPSLALANAVEDATGGKVTPREWDGLHKRKNRRKKDAAL